MHGLQRKKSIKTDGIHTQRVSGRMVFNKEDTDEGSSTNNEDLDGWSSTHKEDLDGWYSTDTRGL